MVRSLLAPGFDPAAIHTRSGGLGILVTFRCTRPDVARAPAVDCTFGPGELVQFQPKLGVPGVRMDSNFLPTGDL
jgi:hypothetical protein